MTDREKVNVEEWTGLPDERLRAVLYALAAEARSARVASAAAHLGGDTHKAAMLGGRASALSRAAALLQQVRDGDTLKAPPYSEARARARAFNERRAARRAQRSSHSG